VDRSNLTQLFDTAGNKILKYKRQTINEVAEEYPDATN
jgi:hypothetical protein